MLCDSLEEDKFVITSGEDVREKSASYLIPTTGIEKCEKKKAFTFHFSVCSEQDCRGKVSDMDHLEIQRQVQCGMQHKKSQQHGSQRSNISKDHHQGYMLAANYAAVMRVLRAVLSLSETFTICLQLANDEESLNSF